MGASLHASPHIVTSATIDIFQLIGLTPSAVILQHMTTIQRLKMKIIYQPMLYTIDTALDKFAAFPPRQLDPLHT
jgi:hypothetical protein